MKSFIRNLSAPQSSFSWYSFVFGGVLSEVSSSRPPFVGSQFRGRVYRQRGTYFGHPGIVGLSHHILDWPHPRLVAAIIRFAACLEIYRNRHSSVDSRSFGEIRQCRACKCHFSRGSTSLPVASHVSLPMLILTLAINPVFEEMIETGYFVGSLERYGMWGAVLASALFRAILHAHLGVNAIVVVFPIGLIFGFVYWRRRQLWPLVVAHVLFDLYALFPRSHA
jgi:hypothetical protein